MPQVANMKRMIEGPCVFLKVIDVESGKLVVHPDERVSDFNDEKEVLLRGNVKAGVIKVRASKSNFQLKSHFPATKEGLPRISR